MKGYFGYGEQSRDTLRGGWLHTGDIGHLDEAGHLYLTGLRKRMINVSGKKVFPAEVERFMRLQGNVDEVCVYGGKAPPAQGQSVRGRVRLKEKGPEAEGAFVDWCAKRISAYKIPRRIEFV